MQQFEIFVGLCLTHHSHSSIFAFCFILPKARRKGLCGPSQVVCCFVELWRKMNNKIIIGIERTLSDVWSFVSSYISLQALVVNLFVIILQILFYLILQFAPPLLWALFLHALAIPFFSFSSMKVLYFGYSSKRTNTTHTHAHTLSSG